MRKRRLKTPSPALTISLIALFVALGGTSYAAVTLPANSVGTRQIKNRAVTAAKINATGLKVPIAGGFINPNGSLGHEWGVVSSSWDSGYSRYVIKLAHTNFFYSHYAVTITPIDANASGWGYDSAGGNLLVEFTGGVQAEFAFTVYKLP